MTTVITLSLITLLLLALIPIYLVTQPTLRLQRSKEKPRLIKAENLKEHVYTIVERFYDRSYKNIAMLDDTAQYIHEHFAKYCDDVKLEPFKVKSFSLKGEYLEYQNVVATFEGSEGKEGEYIVVGGHYDTFAGHAGANDNTSAVAGLMELSRVLSLHPPKSNIILIAYCLEEPPFFGTQKMGSFKHAQNLKLENKNVKLAIVMDMIGFYSLEKGSQQYPIPLMKLFYPDSANYISVVSNLSWKNIFYTRKTKNIFKQSSNLPVYSINAPISMDGIDFSDHRNYWKFDYPAIMITDTAFYRTDNYHTPNDTPDTLNYENMAKVMDGIFELVVKI